MNRSEAFERFYEKELHPVLARLDARRKKICTTMFGTIAGIAIVLIILYLAVPEIRANPQFMLIGLVAGIIIIGIVSWIVGRGFVSDFKHQVIARVVQFFDPSLHYLPDNHIPEHRFMASEIFQSRIDRFDGEDHVSGRIGSTEVEFSELHAQYKTTTTDSKGRTSTRWHTIFKGLYFTADFNKHFRGITVVLPDMAERMFGFLGKKLQEWNMARGELIKLEDPEFEKNFVVYGDDQVEARYILSTSLMRRILDFKRKTGNTVYLSFVRSEVHVAVTTGKNMFEPRIFSSLLDPNLIEEYLDDLELATGIVSDLNLNTRIWTKQ